MALASTAAPHSLQQAVDCLTKTEKGTGGIDSMNAGVLVLMIPIVAIVCSTVLKMARLRAAQGNQSVSEEVTHRLATLEGDVRALQQELGETQERLDFTERLLSKAREERRPT